MTVTINRPGHPLHRTPVTVLHAGADRLAAFADDHPGGVTRPVIVSVPGQSRAFTVFDASELIVEAAPAAV